MAQQTISIADKTTLDAVNAKVGEATDTGGSASAGSVMGKLNAIFGGSEWQYIAGDNLILDLNNTELSTRGVGEVYFPQKITASFGGTLTLKCNLKSTTSGASTGTSTLTAYVNDVSAASVSSGSTSFSECVLNFSFSKGDTIKFSVSNSRGTSSTVYTILEAATLKLCGDVMPKAIFDALTLSTIS